jgi:Fic family protein
MASENLLPIPISDRVVRGQMPEKPYIRLQRGSGVVEAKMENLIHFMNDDRAFAIDPILKMAIGHLQFEAIHPFRDGNGGQEDCSTSIF